MSNNEIPSKKAVVYSMTRPPTYVYEQGSCITFVYGWTSVLNLIMSMLFRESRIRTLRSISRASNRAYINSMPVIKHDLQYYECHMPMFHYVPFFNVLKSSDFLINHGNSSMISLSLRLSGGLVMTFMILSYMDPAIFMRIACIYRQLLKVNCKPDAINNN